VPYRERQKRHLTADNERFASNVKYFTPLPTCLEHAAREYDDFRIAILINWVEHKKHKHYGISAVKCHLIFAFSFLKIASLNWTPWHAVFSYGSTALYGPGPPRFVEVS
jgi:hypothetical protein